LASETDPRRTWEIPSAAYDAMVARAVADYPEETCGLVFGSGDDLEVVPLRNIQNDLHRRFPDAYRRDARTAYEFDTLEKEAVISAHEAAGRQPARPERLAQLAGHLRLGHLVVADAPLRDVVLGGQVVVAHVRLADGVGRGRHGPRQGST